MDKTITTNILESISGKSNAPELTPDNLKFAKVVKKAKEAFDVWKWVDRDSEKLNNKLDEIRKELK